MRLVWWMSRFALMKTFIALGTEKKYDLRKQNGEALADTVTALTFKISIGYQRSVRG